MEIGLIILFVFAAIIIRLIAGGIDKDRIDDYIKSIGGRVIDKSWDPFGPGWFGDKDDRIYQIIYGDSQGNTHRAHVKTSLFSGVYLTNDKIVDSSGPETGEREVDRLKRENEELKRRLSEKESSEQ